MTQVGNVMQSEGDQSINQNRKQSFLQPLKFSLCGKFFLCLKNQWSVYLHHGTHYRLYTGHKAPITHSCCCCILFQKGHANRKAGSLSQAYRAAKACFNLCHTTAGPKGPLKQ